MGKVSALRIMRATYLGCLLLGTLLLGLSALVEPLAYASTPHQKEAAHIDVAVFKLPVTPISAQYYDRLIQAAEDDGLWTTRVERLHLLHDRPIPVTRSLRLRMRQHRA